MVFYIIYIVFGFLFLTAFFGDYKAKELKKEYKYFEKLTTPERIQKENKKHLTEFIILVIIMMLSILSIIMFRIINKI